MKRISGGQLSRKAKATLLSSHAGGPRAATGDTTSTGQTKQPTQGSRVSPPPARRTYRSARTSPTRQPTTLTVTGLHDGRRRCRFTPSSSSVVAVAASAASAAVRAARSGSPRGKFGQIPLPGKTERKRRGQSLPTTRASRSHECRRPGLRFSSTTSTIGWFAAVIVEPRRLIPTGLRARSRRGR